MSLKLNGLKHGDGVQAIGLQKHIAFCKMGQW